MVSLPHEVQGVAAAAGCAIFINMNLVMSKFMKGWELPYLFLAGSAALVIAFGLAMAMLLQGAWYLERREVKWVMLCGFFGCINSAMNPLAVLAGADVGTVGALGSLNTVVAALLGRLVLQEPLGKVHLLAVGLSVLGAVFISDPVEAVASMGSSLLGNMLALCGGIAQGGIFICARKSGGASSMMLSTSAMTQRWIVFWILAFAVPDGRFQSLTASPGNSALLFLGLTVIISAANLLTMVASKKCPAALSSTLMTGSQMTTGYLLDFAVFHSVPKVRTMLGATLMFFSVVTMALTRLPAKSHVPESTMEVPNEWPRTGPRQRGSSALPGIFGVPSASA